MEQLKIRSPRWSGKSTYWLETTRIGQTVNKAIHLKISLILFIYWNKIQRGKFPACTSPLNLQVLTFQQDHLYGICNPLHCETESSTVRIRGLFG